MAIATLTSKGQLTIPQSVRQAMGLSAGARVSFIEEKHGVYRIQALTGELSELKGMLKPAHSVSVDEMNTAIALNAASNTASHEGVGGSASKLP